MKTYTVTLTINTKVPEQKVHAFEMKFQNEQAVTIEDILEVLPKQMIIDAISKTDYKDDLNIYLAPNKTAANES